MQAIHKDAKTLGTKKEALHLFEAATFATKSKPLNWDQDLIDQVVDILRSHPVRIIDLNPGTTLEGIQKTDRFLLRP